MGKAARSAWLTLLSLIRGGILWEELILSHETTSQSV